MKYISNSNYFLINPRHVPSNKFDNSNTGTCTTTAVQMLMGYHNYFSDRRIIPSHFLHDDFGVPEGDPIFERDIVSESVN